MVKLVPDPGNLVLEARAGQPGATTRLVDAWLPVVLAWCMRLGGAHIDAEDAAHDVMIKLLTRLEDIREPERVAGWLFQVTRSVLRSHRRRSWGRRWLGVLPSNLVDRGQSPHDDLEQHEVAKRVSQALEAVPLKYREVLVLCDIEDHTRAEVADMLGIPEGTVKSRVRIGRERLRKAATRHGLSPIVLDMYERGEL